MACWKTGRIDVDGQILRGRILGAAESSAKILAAQDGEVMAKKPTGKNTSGRGMRDLTVKVKTARGRRLSSTRWLQRQLNDPYVARAKAEG